MNTTTLLSAARQRALRDALEKFISCDTQPNGTRLEIVYATRPDWHCNTGKQNMAVLDASFNPPTRAHLALASMPYYLGTSIQNYDAHMLIFSVRNADKGQGRPGDASPLQRLEMIELLAKQLERDLPNPNVAVALVDEPLVFSKSTLIHAALENKGSLQLSWLMGSDTLTRVFQPKYYGSEANLDDACTKFFGEEKSTIVCAERSTDSVLGHADDPRWSGTLTLSDETQTLLSSPGPAYRWARKGAIQMRGLDPEVARHSSTAVRRFLQLSSPTRETRETLSRMVPDTLVDYLLTNDIYGTPKKVYSNTSCH